MNIISMIPVIAIFLILGVVLFFALVDHIVDTRERNNKTAIYRQLGGTHYISKHEWNRNHKDDGSWEKHMENNRRIRESIGL